MKLPFKTEQFLDVFQSYNVAVWPAQVFFNLLAVVLLFFCFKKYEFSGSLVLFSLAFFWFWIGIVYHLIFFSEINPAAYAFAVIFILQGVFFIIAAVKNQIDFRFVWNIRTAVGMIFIIYALILYPLLGIYFGHTYPRNPTFGLPCPTTIFTFGILLIAKNKIPAYLVGIPLIWSIVGFSAAFKLGIAEDTGLIIAGIVGSGLIIFRKKKQNEFKTI